MALVTTAKLNYIPTDKEEESVFRKDSSTATTTGQSLTWRESLANRMMPRCW